MDQVRLERERDRVDRARQIEKRIHDIEHVVKRLAEPEPDSLGTVRVVSSMNHGWRPEIPSERVRSFVRSECESELVTLRMELKAMYPDMGIAYWVKGEPEVSANLALNPDGSVSGSVQSRR